MPTSPALSADPIQHLIAKIEHVTGCDVYLRSGGKDTTWCMAYADHETEFGARHKAVTEGVGPFEALDNLVAKLGYVEDDCGNLIRQRRQSPRPEAMTVRDVVGAVNLLDARVA